MQLLSQFALYNKKLSVSQEQLVVVVGDAVLSLR